MFGRKNIQLVLNVPPEPVVVMYGDVQLNKCYFLREYNEFVRSYVRRCFQ